MSPFFEKIAYIEAKNNNNLSISKNLNNSMIKFIKENLFNPTEGLSADNKQNTQFRKSTTMFRGIIGGGLIALIGDMFWDWFSN